MARSATSGRKSDPAQRGERYAVMSIGVARLRKSFGAARAVDDIDFEVATGQMLVLLGPSGCGKTTTMRCIAGLEMPDAGAISIGTRPVFDSDSGVNVAVNRRNVGMVFQSYAIWPHMTVAENVAYPLDMARVARAEKETRVREILALVGLEGFADRGASYLSGGQMQRVALARSLVMRPAVLLFDEPLSNLDARLRDHLRIELRELQTSLGITGVYVTHDQREALALADVMAVMQQGRIAQIGDPVSVYRGPRTASIAEFLGYSNIFAARVAAGAGGGTAVELEGQPVQLLAAQSPPPGAGEIAACVRPEDVRIEAAGSSEADPNGTGRIRGTVVLASFLGSHMQYRVRVSGGPTGGGAAPKVWEALSTRLDAPLRVGMPAVLEVPPGAVLLLARD